MNRQIDAEMEKGLQFFGKMTASISHEIKNVMAIINESAGLLEDYSLMAEKGMPIDPARLKTVSDRVAAQIRRAEGITTNMNSLAHSVDGFQRSVYIKETLELAVGLARRLADMRSVTLELTPPSDFPAVITSPFHLQNLIWQVLDFAMDASGDGKTVGLFFETDRESVKIRFAGLEGLSNLSEAAFPTKKEAALLEMLGATIHQDVNAREIHLVLPKDIDRQLNDGD
ncbi:MAG: HAMP domain-containing histidine kinase [Deltaproteobacteria bacterium]|nr:HAMP domain-containing histidine kinase [Deltaproteobacteria bacterium]